MSDEIIAYKEWREWRMRVEKALDARHTAIKREILRLRPWFFGFDSVGDCKLMEPCTPAGFSKSDLDKLSDEAYVQAVVNQAIATMDEEPTTSRNEHSASYRQGVLSK